ncbi:MAG: hypothetical protein KDD69_05125 [Bdellovibrionales bacterium]|nr:hypothetical protein [Bdellovibrionales bacterium]
MGNEHVLLVSDMEGRSSSLRSGRVAMVEKPLAGPASEARSNAEQGLRFEYKNRSAIECSPINRLPAKVSANHERFTAIWEPL